MQGKSMRVMHDQWPYMDEANIHYFDITYIIHSHLKICKPDAYHFQLHNIISLPVKFLCIQ